MTTIAERVALHCIGCGGCMVWQGSSSKGKHPQMRIKGRTVSVRKALWEEQHGKLPAGHEVAATCETRNCVTHYAKMTRKQIGARTAATGVYANPVRCAKIAATKQKASGVITREIVQDIRYGPGSLQEAADRHGISKSQAGFIRRGERWKEYSSPFAGLLASNESSARRTA
jgi:hypothetical protein